MQAPILRTEQWTLVDVHDGFALLVNDDGLTRQDLVLDATKYPSHARLAEELARDGEVSVIVVHAMGDSVILPSDAL
jgi:Eukaryotic elongation factor 5A hypusine, DNA-binding OB fold